ncbi:hypothetical protein HCN44_005689 [Aphidius gifuensis]|uniref:Uncharacterized protein n=2 Tax=Aphidius gifuensis TaxID=684658 RepID=A0A834XT04_APHGI|nr:hypothetical protein HCN44_005689 [Aphidius gifuensis]
MDSQEQQNEVDLQEQQIEVDSQEQQIEIDSQEQQSAADSPEQQINVELSEQQQSNVESPGQQINVELSEQHFNVESPGQQIEVDLQAQQINVELSEQQFNVESPGQQFNIELSEQQDDVELTEQADYFELTEQQVNVEVTEQQINLESNTQINIQPPTKEQINIEKPTDDSTVVPVRTRSSKRRRISDDEDDCDTNDVELIHQNTPKDQEPPLVNKVVTTEIPEWFINNIKSTEENQSIRLKEFKDEILSELNHQLGNTLGKIVKNDKLQFEKQILDAMKHCFLEVENEIAIRNLTLLKNHNNNTNKINGENLISEINNNTVNNNNNNNNNDDDDDKEEGEIDNEEKTDSQKDDELIIKLKNIFNDLTENDNKKIYGLLSNLKVSTKKGVENVTNIFFDKAIKMPKLSYELVDRLIRITDFDPAFLHLREYLFKRCENDLANGNIIDEIIFVSFIAKKGYLLPDGFISRCIYYFLEIENKQNIKCLCEFVNIAGEYYRNFPFIIDCFNKFENISAAGKYGKDITDAINQLIYRKNMLWQ